MASAIAANLAKGKSRLAAVREAIIWEIAFAPAACKAQAMHGLMLISLHDGDGTARLAMGHGEWRWSDMLALHHG